MLSSLLRPATRLDSYVCARCSLRARNGFSRTSKRGIGTKYLEKVRVAEEDWQEKAQLIKKGEKQSMLSILEERGYVNQIAGTPKALENLLTTKRIGAYVGIDPTAPSLHVGHMIPFMALFWMYIHGYQTITLLGGATSKIGDPTGRTADREQVHRNVRTENAVRMHYQLKKLWQNVEEHARSFGYKWEWAWRRGITNNNTWQNKLTMIEMLQTLGPGMRMGTLLSRDTVKTKMDSSTGMSFAEFTYPLMQAWDWWHMYHKNGIQLQIGGSDQFGNIVTGMDAINYLRSHHHDPVIRKQVDAAQPLLQPIGMTTSLFTNSKGEKVGKSAGNAVWLDGDMTSPFELYGYWLRQPDADVEQYLKLFTFLPIEVIKENVAEHMKDPKKRIGQHLLAREFLTLVHGKDVAREAEVQHRLLFSKSTTSNSEDPIVSGVETPNASTVYHPDITQEFNKKLAGPTLNTVGPSPAPTLQLPRSLIETRSIGQILYAAGFAKSRSDGHRLASNGGAYIGGQGNFKNKTAMETGSVSWVPIRPWANIETMKFVVDDRLILRKGKATIKIIQLLSEEEWVKSGLELPGKGAGLGPPRIEEVLESKKKKVPKVLSARVDQYWHQKRRLGDQMRDIDVEEVLPKKGSGSRHLDREGDRKGKAIFKTPYPRIEERDDGDVNEREAPEETTTPWQALGKRKFGAQQSEGGVKGYFQRRQEAVGSDYFLRRQQYNQEMKQASKNQAREFQLRWGSMGGGGYSAGKTQGSKDGVREYPLLRRRGVQRKIGSGA